MTGVQTCALPIFARSDIRASQFLRRSIMPEGLLDTMTPEQVSDMFAYLKTLK